MKKISRQEFLRLSALTGFSFLLDSFAQKALGGSWYQGQNNNVIFYKPGDAEYENLRKVYNTRINRRPAMIAFCKTAEGVAEAINIAQKRKWAVTVKSGGHCMEGFSVNDGGMVINLSAMQQIEWLSPDRIRVQPACTLRQLYDEILPKNKILPGGSCAGVALGGLSLGGGYGLMSRRYGLTCDNLLALQLIDGSGKIHDVKEGNELLWACRGGGNANFGVVTSLEFKLHPAPVNLQSYRFKSFKMTAAAAKEKMKAWFSIAATLPETCFSAFLLNYRTVYILLTNSGKQSPALQKAIEDLNKLTEKFTQTQPEPLTKALKVYYGRPEPMAFKNASSGLYKSFDDIDGCVEDALKIVTETPGMIYQVNTLGGAVLRSGNENSAAFAYRDYLFFSELQTYWGNPAKEPSMLNKFEQVQQVFTKHGIKAQYRNYPDINFKNWAESYYGNSLNKLKQIKSKYDPGNLFKGMQSL
jgi:FAD/FMN-containing dehydrogenase